MAPSNCAVKYSGILLKSPVLTATPNVTAGLRCASGLPHAMAVKTPVITASAQPAVITIQPEPSPFDFRSSTLATTPLPIRMSTIVPMNSPRNRLSTLVLHPIERSRHCLLPKRIQALAPRRIHLWLPGVLHGPTAAEVIDIFVKPYGQTRCVRRAESRRLFDRGAHDSAVEDVGLELHEQLVFDHPAIGAKDIYGNAGVLLHGLHHLPRLERSGLQHRPRQVAFVRVARQPCDHAARIVLPIGRVQAREGGHEIYSAVVLD